MIRQYFVGNAQFTRAVRDERYSILERIFHRNDTDPFGYGFYSRDLRLIFYPLSAFKNAEHELVPTICHECLHAILHNVAPDTKAHQEEWIVAMMLRAADIHNATLPHPDYYWKHVMESAFINMIIMPIILFAAGQIIHDLPSSTVLALIMASLVTGSIIYSHKQCMKHWNRTL